jgi:hypothetical protein
VTLIVHPAMSDDSGTKTDGTVVNKAFIDALIALVDDQTHSAANPTVKPKTATDEVIAGRGGYASLDARFDIIDAEVVVLQAVPVITRLTTNVTPSGSVGAAETDLFSYSIPAATLSADNQAFEFEIWGATANNATAKTLRVYFGAAQIGTWALTANSVAAWFVRGSVVRTGAATQLGRTVAIHTLTAPTAPVGGNTGAETLSGAVTFRATGQGGANNDITFALMIAKKAA